MRFKTDRRWCAESVAFSSTRMLLMVERILFNWPRIRVSKHLNQERSQKVNASHDSKTIPVDRDQAVYQENCHLHLRSHKQLICTTHCPGQLEPLPPSPFPKVNVAVKLSWPLRSLDSRGYSMNTCYEQVITITKDKNPVTGHPKITLKLN